MIHDGFNKNELNNLRFYFNRIHSNRTPFCEYMNYIRFDPIFIVINLF